jgi:hypothetical protein
VENQKLVVLRGDQKHKYEVEYERIPLPVTHNEFKTYIPGAKAIEEMQSISQDFDDLLTKLESKLDTTRELALVRTHLEIACFYARKAKAKNRLPFANDDWEEVSDAGGVNCQCCSKSINEVAVRVKGLKYLYHKQCVIDAENSTAWAPTVVAPHVERKEAKEPIPDSTTGICGHGYATYDGGCPVCFPLTSHMEADGQDLPRHAAPALHSFRIAVGHSSEAIPGGGDAGAPEYSWQAVLDGFWEIYHDDSCGETLTLEGLCPKCKFHPDMQSKGARRVKPISAVLGHPELTVSDDLAVGSQPCVHGNYETKAQCALCCADEIKLKGQTLPPFGNEHWEALFGFGPFNCRGCDSATTGELAVHVKGSLDIYHKDCAKRLAPPSHETCAFKNSGVNQ